MWGEGGGGRRETFIDVELLGENHHKFAGEDLSLDEGVVLHLWITSYTASLSGQVHDMPL